MRNSVLAAMQISNRKLHKQSAEMVGADDLVKSTIDDFRKIAIDLAKKSGDNLSIVVVTADGQNRVINGDPLGYIKTQAVFTDMRGIEPSLNSYIAWFVQDVGKLSEQDGQDINKSLQGTNADMADFVAAMPRDGSPVDEVMILPTVNVAANSPSAPSNSSLNPTPSAGQGPNLTPSGNKSGINPIIAVLGFGGGVLALAHKSKKR